MQVLGIRYRNTQGTLMRILNAVSRRGIEMPFVQATPSSHSHTVTLLLDLTPKQIGQLRRDWNAIVDVTEVRAGGRLNMRPKPSWTAPAYPAVNAGIPAAQAVNAGIPAAQSASA